MCTICGFALTCDQTCFFFPFLNIGEGGYDRRLGLPGIVLLSAWPQSSRTKCQATLPIQSDKELNLRTGSPLSQILSFLLRFFFTLCEIKLH